MTEQTPDLTAIHVVFHLVTSRQLGVNPIGFAQVGPELAGQVGPTQMKIPQPQWPRVIQEFSNLGGRQVCHVHRFDSETDSYKTAARYYPSSSA